MQASTVQLDVEKNPKQPEGYPSLAAWIARDPDNETFIFRKFDELSAKNLWNMQNGLIRIEEELKAVEHDIWTSKEADVVRGLGNWEHSQKRVQEQEGREIVRAGQTRTGTETLELRRARLERSLKVQLKEYHKALILQSKICKLDRPSKRAQTTFQSKLHGSKGSDPIIYGKAQNALDDRKDLVLLRPALDTDPLSLLLRAHWLGPVKPNDNDTADKTEHFSGSHVSLAVAIINTVVAMLILIASIVTLFFVRRPKVKLALIAIFTIIFATSIGCLTSAKRQEIFAASAAYTAVLLVFVSGNLKNP